MFLYSLFQNFILEQIAILMNPYNIQVLHLVTNKELYTRKRTCVLHTQQLVVSKI